MMLTRTIAIAWLTIREAVRSKLLLSLTCLLVAGLFGLPMLIAGDNTLEGKVQVILTYTLAFATGLLSLTTLWTACGGLSSEIQDRRLYLVLTKPLHRHELWLGKWLGIMGLNIALMGLSGLIISAMTHHAIRNSGDSLKIKRQVSEQFLLARLAVPPLTPDWSQTLSAATQRLLQSGRIPTNMTPEAIRQKLIEEIKIQHFTIPPGGGVQFSFQIPAKFKHGHDLLLRYKFDSTRPERNPVAAQWTIGTAPGPLTHIGVTNYPGIPAVLVLDAQSTAGSNLITVAYQRQDTQSQATLLFADTTQEPELLMPCGSFEMNLIRGLFVILCRLAFLAALGLTAGCLLSTPVALFTAFFILILMASAGYVESVATTGVFYIPHEGPALDPNWLDRAILHIFRGFNVITHPLIQLDPAPLLASGRVVGGKMVLLALGWLAGLYSAISALIGIALFNRRELG